MRSASGNLDLEFRARILFYFARSEKTTLALVAVTAGNAYDYANL